MFVLPKGTLVHFRGMPFRLLADAETDGLQSNYDLVAGERPRVSYGPGQVGSKAATSHSAASLDSAGVHAVTPVTSETITTSS